MHQAVYPLLSIMVFHLCFSLYQSIQPHPVTQIISVISGTLQFTIGDETGTVHAGNMKLIEDVIMHV